MSTSSITAATVDPIELTIEPRIRSLGEFDVRRVLPAAERRMVGPFVFLDHMGPAVFPPGHGIAVRPHPHIGLATITYLFEGEIMHRDSLGCVQLIQTGAVNLMTAGRGIVHSERASDDLGDTSRLHGIQSWLALPLELEEMPPAFIHYPADALPELTVGRATVRVIMGEAYGARSPVVTHSPTLYLEVRLPAGAELSAADPCERARGVHRRRRRHDRDARLPGRHARRRAHRRRRASAGGRRESRHGRRRRAARAPSHLVEFRVELEGADGAGQTGLGRRPLR